MGTVLGSLIGLCFCEVMRYALKRGFIDRESYVAQYIALVFLTIGTTGLLGTDDLIAAFAAGACAGPDKQSVILCCEFQGLPSHGMGISKARSRTLSSLQLSTLFSIAVLLFILALGCHSSRTTPQR